MGEIENLRLEHLKRFQATLDRFEPMPDGLTGRLANLGGGQAAVVRHLAHLAAADAAQHIAIDTVNGRLNRLERRLELAR